MKNEILKPAAEVPKFLSGTLISSDFLKHKMDEKKHVTNSQTNNDKVEKPELLGVTERSELIIRTTKLPSN